MSDKTYEEFVALVAAGELLRLGPWAKTLGGPGFIDPPLSTKATLVLEPGSYALGCFVTTPGNPPEHLRIFRLLQVVPAISARSIELPTDLV